MIRYLTIFVSIFFFAAAAGASEDMVTVIEKQRVELNQKEDIIKQETDRLRTIKKEVEEDIVKYNSLLKKIEASLKQAEEIGSKRLKHVAKAYEAMPPEDAASRLSGLDNETAVQILLKMNSKKAGLVIGMMHPAKASKLTKSIAKIQK